MSWGTPYKKGQKANNLIDLTDKIFGHLKVLSKAESIVRIYNGLEKRASRWNVICLKCKTKFITDGQSLREGKTKSCGCSHPLKVKLNIQALNALFNRYKQNAKSRNLEFSLTKDEFLSLIHKSCYYCKSLNTNNYTCRYSKKKYSYNGIDRIDNTKGYTLENSVPCCIICNVMKMDLSYSNFISHIKNIIKITNER